MSVAQPDSQTLMTIYRKMTVIKLNDDRFIGELKAGRMAMPYYSARGQEAISAAVSANLDDDDYIVTIYRGIHDMLGKGVPPSCCGLRSPARRPEPARARAGRCISRTRRADAW